MNVSERVASSEWAAVTHMGEEIAEAWFKPDGEESTLMFRVPRDRFQGPDASRRLTMENLLKAAGLSPDVVESWRVGGEFHAGLDGTDPELRQPLPPPPPDATHLTIQVRLTSAPPAAGGETGVPDVPPETWQALEAVWRSILGLEVSIDTLRFSMDGLRIELEAGFKKQLVVEEKVHALQVDVVQWTKAKNRVHFVLPKVREYIHRATWAAATPERKRMDELVRTHIEPRIPLAEMDQLRAELDHLQKDRQVLFAPGQLGLPGGSKHPGGDPAGREYAPAERGRPGPSETSTRAGEGQAPVTGRLASAADGRGASASGDQAVRWA